MIRILVPVGLHTKPEPYTFLRNIFRDREVEAVLYTVVTLPATTSLEYGEYMDLPIVEKMREKLNMVSKIFREELGFMVAEKIVFARDVVEAIVEEVIQNPYDMVVLVKRRRVPRFIGRSVSRSLLPRISKPILILTMD